MTVKNEYIISKISNFPDGYGGVTKVYQKFAISTENRKISRVECCNTNNNLFDYIKWRLNGKANSPALFCEDENGIKITLIEVSITIQYNRENDSFCFWGSHFGIILGSHVSQNPRELSTSKISVLFADETQFGCLRAYNGEEFSPQERIKVNITAEMNEDSNYYPVVKAMSTT